MFGSGTEPTGQAGISEGLDVFAGVTPAVGAYTLAVTVPANVAQPTYRTTASLYIDNVCRRYCLRPQRWTAAAAEHLLSRSCGGYGGVIQVTDYGPCQRKRNNANSNSPAARFPIYYTLDGYGSGMYSLVMLPARAARRRSALPPKTLLRSSGATTTGDQFTVQSIGFDYPLYENSPSSSKVALNPSPTLTGGNGQADVTVSSAVVETQTASGLTPTPASRARLHRSTLSVKRRH